ncbi:oligosaccharide flippase family protein [Cloacibacillus evryensis]|uniref:oligosaccharide flippase family protein n=1 Tax=Cloacibacillus evryensis TaxID=508460 RepID=UPI0004B80079|nr:oligosaccharide flippase family protein [Cloacibacillus evryensis]MEA5035709.1 oligosaccharide flippase family protein [Cloacibacillus evryensis]
MKFFLRLQPYNSIVIKNTSMLYLFSIASLVFPLLTLPYLTRVLSIEYYGISAYVKSCMAYFTVFLEFGFLLSATRDIVNANNDCQMMSQIVGAVTMAKVLLSAAALFAMLAIFPFLPILGNNKLFTLLSFCAIAINALIPDYLFRGLNAMEVITYRFIVCKAISVLLTFVLVKDDSDFLLIPLLDFGSSILALALSIGCMHKRNISLPLVSIKLALSTMIKSFTYFISDFATTAFSALCTILIGLYLNITDVAYWSLSITLVGAAQSLFSPIMNGIYPYMVSTRDLSLIKKILAIFLPMITLACLIACLYAPQLLYFVSGEKYIAAAPIFRMLLPLVLISFPGMLCGWPSLGAINRAKEVSITSSCAVIFQIISLIILITNNHFNIINIVIVRTMTETILFITRWFFCYRYRKEFTNYARKDNI